MLICDFDVSCARCFLLVLMEVELLLPAKWNHKHFLKAWWKLVISLTLISVVLSCSSASSLYQPAWCLSANSFYICTPLTHTTCWTYTHWSLAKTDCMQCMSLLCSTLTFSCLCFTVLSLRCVGRCVRYTCWRTRFLCVRLSGSGCLTPLASLVWRQVRGGHISAVPSEPPTPWP